MVRSTGRHETTVNRGEPVRAFVQPPLRDPPLDLVRLDACLRAAERGVARLEVARGAGPP